MSEHTENSKLHVCLGFFLLLYQLCFYNALHIVGAQIFEEGGRKAKKEGRIQTGENFISRAHT